MTLLIVYILLAILVSFACSIFEAVLLSINNAHVELLKSKNEPVGFELDKLKNDIGKPLAAILTLNTIAHTIGAAGAGAQAAVVFGNAYLGVFSAVLTLLILIFSEIIPKTIGASYWKKLTPITTYCLKYLV
ncbi:MAG: CNNM domain-containing protein [Kangiellaceae bacterium]|nr:CNNM domain-containing protein [Kangiellaceae bacterium]